MTLRPRDRIALGVILLLGVVFGYYKLLLSPERSQASALTTSIAGERQTLATEQQTFATGRAAAASLRADAQQWAALRLAVPAQSDIPGLLRSLQRTADSANVKMRSITLSGSGSSGATTPATPATPTTPTSATTATPIPIQLTFAGGYAALDRLVKRLDQFVVVSGTKVRATGPLLSISSVSLSGSPDLTVQLTASIYQLPAPAAAGATTGG
jgi:Tfp pilus assembly protein PilO